MSVMTLDVRDLARRAADPLATVPGDGASAVSAVPPLPREPRPAPTLAPSEPTPPPVALPARPHPAPALAPSVLAAALADLRDDELVEVIASWERVVSAATARQAEAISELVARRGSREHRFVPDEVACALACTRRAAALKVELAEGLAAFPALHDGLARGDLDVRKARVVLDEVAGAGPSVAHAVVREAVADAPGMTAPQLARQARRSVLAADPGEAGRRCARARADRQVRLEPAGDAMCWLHALLPAAEATAAFTTIDALADAAATTGDPRSIDQRRADAFADVFAGILDSGVGPYGALPRRHGVRPQVQVTVAATTLLGLDEAPGELAGYGPVPASLARELAGRGTWRRILTDPTSGTVLERGRVTYRPGADLTGTVVARDVTCTFPGCRQPAARADLDHVQPYDPRRPAADQTRADNLHALCRHHHLAKTHAHWTVERDDRTGITRWTSPAGITYTRNPVAVLAPATRGQHSPGTHAGPTSTGDPPF